MKETIRFTTLPNGLRVATDTVDGAETTAIGVWTNCGARHETAAINGAAHMLEHMLFKGTTRRSAQDIAEEMEAVGGQMNAYTGRENTAYYARVLKDDAALALDILADILQNSRFAADDLTREKQVVLQELGQALDTPDDIVYDYFQEAAFPDQPVGRSILGTETSVGSLTPEALRGYVGRHYAPSRLVLAAAGGIDHDWLVKQATALFTTLAETPETPLAAARYTGGDFRRDADLEQVHFLLGFEGVGFHDRDYYAVQIFSTAFGGGMSSRLFQEVREKRGLVYSIHSFLSDFADGGLFGIYAGTSADSLKKLMPVLGQEIAKTAKGFSDSELSRAKAQMRASFLMGLENCFNRAETLALNLLSYDRVIPTVETLAMIEAVDGAALKRVAQRMLASKATVTALGPLANLEPYDAIAARCAA